MATFLEYCGSFSMIPNFTKDLSTANCRAPYRTNNIQSCMQGMYQYVRRIKMNGGCSMGEMSPLNINVESHLRAFLLEIQSRK